MLCFPNAKINIGLYVTEKRADGFHNIESLFYPIGLSDVLEVIEDKGKKRSQAKITVTGIKFEGDPADNLCLKVYLLLNKDIDLPPVKIHLHKCIPVGAGLGGGSSDAAYFIKLLNEKFRLGLSDEAMMDYARKIGSDCAFFIKNKPVIATEKGDVFENAEVEIKDSHLVLVHPGIHISTIDAYSWIKPFKRKKSLEEQMFDTVTTKWEKNILNDFEAPVFERYPEIKAIKNEMYELGAYYASLSGSGSAVYGLFDTKLNIKKIFSKCFVWEERL